MIGRAAGAVGSMAAQAWGRATRRPVDAFAIFGAGAATMAIIVNAVFLQSGSHPAPFFNNPSRRVAASELRPKPVEAATPQPAEPAPAARSTTAPAPPQRAPQTVSMRRNDPIAEMIGPSPRIAAVQRVLSEYGYGQIKPSGVLDDATGAAIEKFEHDHKMPVTGRVSNRLMTELGTLAGHPLE